MHKKKKKRSSVIKTRPYAFFLSEMEDKEVDRLFGLKEFESLLDRGADIGIVWHISGGNNRNIIKCLEPENKIGTQFKKGKSGNGPFIFAQRIVESIKSGQESFMKILEEYKEIIMTDHSDKAEDVIQKMSDIFWQCYKEDAIEMLKLGNTQMTEDQIDTVIDSLKKESLEDLNLENS